MKKINLNELLLSLSYVLDFVEMDVLGVASNHSKRVAYISTVMAKDLKLCNEQRFDIVALSILHDNGLTERALRGGLGLEPQNKRKFLEGFKDHCIIGEENIKKFPFLTDVKNALKYHHESYDGGGFFKIKGEAIPKMSQIISFADTIDTQFNLKLDFDEKKQDIISYIRKKENKWFSTEIIESFIRVSDKPSFSLDLRDEFISRAIKRNLIKVDKELTYEEVREITNVFSKIIDCKSPFTATHSQGLAEKTEIMADFYNKGRIEKMKLLIAADLHDIGKLTVPNSILDKPGRLDRDEFRTIQTHTYYTRVCLESLCGFEDITEWASNHHEKLNGTGYPYGFDRSKLDFNSRLMACIDIYQALREDRPYRSGLSHSKSINILTDMAQEDLVDLNIVKDIDYVFGKETKISEE